LTASSSNIAGDFTNSAGDSVVAEFATVVDAVQCAVVVSKAR
jgi:class 3 adenylate cyclase